MQHDAAKKEIKTMQHVNMTLSMNLKVFALKSSMSNVLYWIALLILDCNAFIVKCICVICGYRARCDKCPYSWDE